MAERDVSFDLKSLLASHAGEEQSLFAEHVNPKFARVLKTIGFDRDYVRGSGSHLWDREGRRYLDMIGGYAVCNVGRNHPVVRRALEDFLACEAASMVAFDAPLLAGLLARELKTRVGRDLEYVFFTNSGTEGAEAALKFARCATGRPGVIYTERAFHGLTLGALSVNGCESFRAGFAPHLPECRAVPFNDLAALERALSAGDVGAFIVEPIQGKGVNLPSPGYLAEAGRLCRRYGALFIVDEVQTGVARTGSFLAIDQEGDVAPDIVVMSKALSGGYVPVGAVLVRGPVWNKVFSSLDRAIVHSSTFHMNGMAMTAALAVLSVIDEERLAERAVRMGTILAEGIRAIAPRFEFIREVRQRGLLIAIEFHKPRSVGLRTAWSLVHAMDQNLFAQAIVVPLMEDHAILTQVAGHNMPTVKLAPPLSIDEDDCAAFLRAFEKVMVGLHSFPGPAWDVVRRLGRNILLPARRRGGLPERVQV